MISRRAFCGATLEDLERLLSDLGEPAWRARQMFRHIYVRGEADPERMTDLPGVLRTTLAERCVPGIPAVHAVHTAGDGSRKLVFRLDDGVSVEGVLLPGDRPGVFTQCLSTQAGCTLDCVFCRTGRLGLRRNLEAGEIVGQVLVARALLGDAERCSRLVLMGMGEPLANYDAVVSALRLLTDPAGCGLSPRRITVSTAGLPGRIPQLGRDTDVCLAVSLNATTDALRARLMPRAHALGSLDELLAACRAFPTGRYRRLTFEYVLLAEVNDTPDDARRLVRLAGPLRAKVNLIPFNPWADAPQEAPAFSPPDPARVEAFRRALVAGGVPASVRASRGDDILAACGQLGA